MRQETQRFLSNSNSAQIASATAQILQHLCCASNYRGLNQLVVTTFHNGLYVLANQVENLIRLFYLDNGQSIFES